MFVCLLVLPPPVYVSYSGLPVGVMGFDRSQLLEDMEDKCRTFKSVIMSSPAGTGKTTCLQMFCRKNIPNMNRTYVKLNKQECAIDVLKECGLDLSGIECTVDSRYHGKLSVFLLDDAQWRYEEHALWEKIMKNESYTPSNIRFLISATHHLGGKESPVYFRALSPMCKISFDRLLLDEDQSKQISTLSLFGMSWCKLL